MSQPDHGPLGPETLQALAVAQNLTPTDTSSLQNEENFDETAQRCFSTWKTSLMGSDLQALEKLSLHERLQKYVKTIHIQDDWENNDPGPMIAGPDAPPPSNAVHIWPRNEERLVQTDELGIARLQNLLKSQSLRPERIAIRDFRGGNLACDPEPCAVLARQILDDTDVAIASFAFQRPRDSYGALEMIIRLSPQDKGRGAGFSKLQSAQLISTANLGSYWPEALCQSSQLLDLSISYGDPRPRSQQLFETYKVAPKLSSLTLNHAVVSSQAVLDVLANSWATLTSITIRGVGLGTESWPSLLTQISEQCTCLTSFNVGLLSVDAGSLKFVLGKDSVPEHSCGSLELTEKGPEGQRRVNAVRYSGEDAAEILKVVAGSITSRW